MFITYKKNMRFIGALENKNVCVNDYWKTLINSFKIYKIQKTKWIYKSYKTNVQT